MMVVSYFAKGPSLGGAFLLKLGTLGLGVGWVCWVGWLSPPNQLVSDVSPALPEVIQALPIEPMGLERPKSLPPPMAAASLPSKNLPISVPQVERAGLTSPTKALLDVNGATQEELEQLPGLGTLLAHRIIAYRQTNGPFHRVEELERVRGIGHKRIQQLRPLITIASGKA